MNNDFFKLLIGLWLIIAPIKPLLAEVEVISPGNITKQFGGPSNYQGEGPRSITFRSFGKEFMSTNSIDDYYRSLSRIQKLYRVKLSDNTLESVYEEVKSTRLSKAFLLFLELEKEALLKAENRDNTYYQKLETLCKWLQKISEAAYIEMLLVDLQRETRGEANPFANRLETTRFSYLIQHARYEVFSKTLFNLTKSD